MNISQATLIKRLLRVHLDYPSLYKTLLIARPLSANKLKNEL